MTSRILKTSRIRSFYASVNYCCRESDRAVTKSEPTGSEVVRFLRPRSLLGVSAHGRGGAACVFGPTKTERRATASGDRTAWRRCLLACAALATLASAATGVPIARSSNFVFLIRFQYQVLFHPWHRSSCTSEDRIARRRGRGRGAMAAATHGAQGERARRSTTAWKRN